MTQSARVIFPAWTAKPSDPTVPVLVYVNEQPAQLPVANGTPPARLNPTRLVTGIGVPQGLQKG